MRHNSEDYLLTIWELNESLGTVSEKGVSQRMSISPPSAWEGIHKLQSEKLVNLDRRGLTFSRKGFLKATEVIRAHRITEYFVYSYLEVPWDEVHAAVMDLEHDFNGRMVESLYKKMGSPSHCPHGNPILPSSKEKEISANDAVDGNYIFGRQTLEERELLKKLFNSGTIPGKAVRLEKNGGRIYLSGENGEISLDPEIARTVRLKY